MSNVVKLKKRALEYEQKKQFDKALETYIQVLGNLDEHMEEADVALFNRVGDLLLRKGNVGSAVDHYERAVDLYTDGGFLNNAIALCNKILRNAPGRSSVYYKLGRISAKKGFINDAKQNFLEYADRMQRIGELEEAFRALKEFADLCPDQDDIRLMLAEQLVRGERKSEAIEQLQFLFEKFQAEGRTQEARATEERMRAIDPDFTPRSGVSRPTPKANDLIFLDVNYDEPAGSARSKPLSAPTRSADEPPAHAGHSGSGAGAHSSHPAAPAPEASIAGRLDVEPSVADEQPLDIIEPSVPPIDLGLDAAESVSPLPGLSPGAALDGVYDTNAVQAGGERAGSSQGSDIDVELINGFEQTSLGMGVSAARTIEPIADLERTTESTLATGEHEIATRSEHLSSSLGNGAGLQPAEPESSSDDLPLIDLSLDMTDGAGPSSNELTLIFPDAAADVANAGSAAQSANGSAPEETIDWGALGGDSQRFEPLLQLPEIEADPEAAGQLTPAPGEDRSTAEPRSIGGLGADPPDALAPAEPRGDAATTGSAAAASTGQPRRLEYLDSGNGGAAAAPAAAPEPAIATLELLRAQSELVPDDWDVHRRLGEALLEDGDRDGGLAELEVALLGYERSGDIRSANAVVVEMIRVEPGEVRLHQKRVEYAVRAGDRAGLAAAYFSLAESLLTAGDLEKSRAVYSRVLELTPDDARARLALEAIGSTARPTPAARPAISPPSANGATPVAQRAISPPSANGATPVAQPAISQPSGNGAAPAAKTVVSSPSGNGAGPRAPTSGSYPVPRAKPPESAASNGATPDFVNLSDWLVEDRPERSTRMVVDVREPETQEQVDFAEMLSMFKQGVAANMDESDHESHYDLGVAYKEMGLLDEAISEFQKALRGTEQRVRAYEALGQCFVEKRQYQIAVTILSRALGDKSNTDDMLVGVLYLLGYASETLGRWTDAQRFYERVFGVDIDFRDVRERLATVEQTVGGGAR